MYSRNGNAFKYPASFTKNWPNVPLDGELFTGRGDFNNCSKIVLNRTKKNECFKKDRYVDEEAYKNVVYVVFDCPALDKPWKERIKALESEIQKIDSNTI